MSKARKPTASSRQAAPVKAAKTVRTTRSRSGLITELHKIRTAVGAGDMTPEQALGRLQRRLAKPPDGRHDPRYIFGSGLTLEQIASTLYSADWGAPRQLTDLSRETIDTDPHLAAVLGKRFNAVASLPIEWSPAEGPGIDPEKASFYADVVRAQLDRVPNRRLAVEQIAWGLFDGRSAQEKHWAWAPGALTKFGRVKFVLSAFSWIHPRRIFFGPERELRIIDRPIGSGFTRDGIAMRDFPFKFLQFTPQLFGEYPEREGLSRRCLYWSFMKRFSARERMILLELFTKPWRWAEVDVDAEIDTDELADIDDFVEQIAGNGYGRLPRGATFKTEQPAKEGSSSGGTIHKEVIDQSDAQMSKLVLGQTGTTDAKAMGLGSEQSRVMQDEQTLVTLGDADRIGEVFKDYVGDEIIELNFGSSEVSHAPRCKLKADLADRTKEVARLQGTLNTGLPVSLRDAYEVVGFRQPDPTEPVLRMEAPVPTTTTGPDGSQVPGPAGAARAVIAYPPGTKTEQRIQEAPSVQVGGDADTTPVPDDPESGGAGSAAVVPESGGALGEGDPSPVVETPEDTDPDQAGEATGGVIERETNPDNPDDVPRGVMSRAFAPFPGGVPRAVSMSAGQLDEAGARRVVAELGQLSDAVILAMAKAPQTALTAMDRFGEHVCCGRQPSTTYGSPESIIDKTTRELSLQTREWANEIIGAGAGGTTAGQIYSAIYHAWLGLDRDEFARSLGRRVLHGEMLGALDSHFERNTDETVDPAKFAAHRDQLIELVDPASILPRPTFSDLSYKSASEFFKSKKVMPKATFDQLATGAKSRAFSIARMTSKDLLDLVHAELGKMISQGADLKQFSKFMRERVESAGWTPTSSSHVETIARTNLTQAYTVGRLKDATSPAALVDRPYWQIRGVKDSRQRATHGAVDGFVLKASDPFFQTAVPGAFGYNDRCRFSTLSAKQVKERGLEVRSGSEISGLPDPGFDSSGARSLLSSFGV